jgi:FkbM family methyltransferase
LFDVPVVSEKDILQIADKSNIAVIICGATFKEYQKTVYAVENVLSHGYNKRQIFLLARWYRQYFNKDIMKPKEHEIFVDAGAMDLGTSMDFISWANGAYDYIYAFEPNTVLFCRCKETAEKLALTNNKFYLYNQALSIKSAKVGFKQKNNGAGKLDPNGDIEIETVTLDEVLNGRPVTFIKMDIEGAELDALKGAQNTITKWKPRLAICLYHKMEDIIDIPAYILSLVPEYKMYIRHYSTVITEMVLLCII